MTFSRLSCCATAMVVLGMVSLGPAGAQAAKRSKGARERHWSFRPVQRPALPKIRGTAWVESPVDFFILSQLEHNKLGPAPDADRRTLLRRVYHDLIGLPPSPAEVRAFLRDRSPRAFARVVDDLLAGPAFGV